MGSRIKTRGLQTRTTDETIFVHSFFTSETTTRRALLATAFMILHRCCCYPPCAFPELGYSG